VNTRLVIFTEMDGPLHDPSAGAFAAAARVLETLRRANVSLVFSSRKTRAELEHIQQELGIRDPFVCESGAAAFIPRGYFGWNVDGARPIAGYEAVEFGGAYSDVVATLHRTAANLRVAIVGYNDMSVEEVARECQVTLLRARLAKLREYDEPFRILDPHARVRKRLFKALRAARLQCTSVGRYNHVGAMVDRHAAVNLLRTLYRRASSSLFTVALVDPAAGGNLLERQDHLVTLGNDDVAHETLDVVEWARAIEDVVHEVQRTDASSLFAGRV
jgi:mannosyl-3-phosphoglycerate phosphatase family protein